MALAKDYPVSTSYLGSKLKKRPRYIGMFRHRLIDSQIIMPAGYLQLKFSLPLFREFVVDDGRYLIRFSEE